MKKSEEENKFTSTGIKFWRHPNQMNAYRNGDPNTVISTHISPEGACNLKCPYCSVTYRKVSNRIEFDVIEAYVDTLVKYGLKAVILTGGGEPTIYPRFNDLVRMVVARGLKIALITNGTQARRVDADIWKHFSWIRTSINIFDGWEEKIQIPVDLVSPECVTGCSFVFTQKHEVISNDIDVDLLKRVAVVARKNGAKYVRLLPNCLLKQVSLIESHALLDTLLEKVGDPIFFHQYKLHGVPKTNICHQSYFRPYLSEVPFKGTGVPGSVYPCDSVVLNNEYAQFMEKYQLCSPADIGSYLEKRISHMFDPTVDCSGCVFTDNVNMLSVWKESGVGSFRDEALMHEEFV